MLVIIGSSTRLVRRGRAHEVVCCRATHDRGASISTGIRVILHEAAIEVMAADLKDRWVAILQPVCKSSSAGVNHSLCESAVA
eukprot:4157433-Prymnesium_polylepis.2